ncbi:MAG TPA: type III secretion system chaperone [Herbaspirillum sp.]|jgi:hypothetical protein
MHLSTIFAHWSAHLRRRSNDASLAFDSDGTLSLLVGRHKIDLRIVPDSLVLRARICGMPGRTEEQHAWLCRILTLSNIHAHNRREFPALTAQRVLQLHTWIRPHADYEGFCIAFDHFMEALETWRHALAPANMVTPVLPAGSLPFSHLLSDTSLSTL